MERFPETILVSIGRLDDWFVAKSDNLPGFHVTDPEFDVVAGEIKSVIKIFYKEKYNVDVEVKQDNNVLETGSKNPFPIAYTAREAFSEARY